MMENDSDFNRWKTHIRAGNSCFKNRQILAAISHYKEAEFQARCLIGSSPNKSGAIAALIASHHNLAEIYRREQEPQLCEQSLSNSLRVINELLVEFADDTETYLALLHGKNTAYCALLHYQKTTLEVSSLTPDLMQCSSSQKATLN